MEDSALSRIRNGSKADFENEAFLKDLDRMRGWAQPLAQSLQSGLLNVEKALDANVRTDISEMMMTERNKLLAMQKVVTRFGKDRCEDKKSKLAEQEMTLIVKLSELSSEVSKLKLKLDELRELGMVEIGKSLPDFSKMSWNFEMTDALRGVAREVADGDVLMEAGMARQIQKSESEATKDAMTIEEIMDLTLSTFSKHKDKMEELGKKEEELRKKSLEKDGVVSELAGMFKVGAALQEMGNAIGGVVKNEERARSLRRRLKEKVDGRTIGDAIVHTAKVYEKYWW